MSRISCPALTERVTNAATAAALMRHFDHFGFSGCIGERAWAARPHGRHTPHLFAESLSWHEKYLETGAT